MSQHPSRGPVRLNEKGRKVAKKPRMKNPKNKASSLSRSTPGSAALRRRRKAIEDNF